MDVSLAQCVRRQPYITWAECSGPGLSLTCGSLLCVFPFSLFPQFPSFTALLFNNDKSSPKQERKKANIICINIFIKKVSN